MIRFLLNRQPVEVDNISVDTTVLDYLRHNLKHDVHTNNKRRTGTKEGCCSGDCGACTVVVGEPVNGELQYRTMNACIALLPSLHGKQLITVEDLAEGDALHPVQQAMVDNHASQCGFCTPGIVMSLFALHQNTADTRPEPMEALGGNLCRCTGYRPILDAAQALADKTPADQFYADKPAVLATLQELTDDVAIIPTEEDQLAQYLEKYPDARILAGGTDLGLEVTQQLKSIERLVYIKNIRSLQTISVTDTTIVVGATANITDLKRVLQKEFPQFGAMLERFGAQQVRNQGTMGGNIASASPIGDTPPALFALGAVLELRKGKNSRFIPIENFYLDYKKTTLQKSEFIARIHIPRGAPNLKVYKVSKRYGDDISTVLAAINLTLDNQQITEARIAFGGMAATPKRARLCEQALVGQTLNQQTLAAAKAAILSEFNPLSDVRASREYRLQCACNLLERYFHETCGAPVRILSHA